MSYNNYLHDLDEIESDYDTESYCHDEIMSEMDNEYTPCKVLNEPNFINVYERGFNRYILYCPNKARYMEDLL